MHKDIFEGQPTLQLLAHRHTVLHYFIAEALKTGERISFVVVDSGDDTLLEVGQGHYLTYKHPADVFNYSGVSIGRTADKSIIVNQALSVLYGDDWKSKFEIVDDQG